ncbi:glycosyltransferase family 1 protein [Enterococcus malodoratus]|uniref:glycosyltransferase family 1 protein n=1 Tax=Enterococcus malodoratus TaxID=71451 RepID=UPI003FD0B498
MPKTLSQITLFTMGKTNLEKRILKAYTESPDADTMVQYLVAVLIRQCLCVSDFAGICNDLVREIFLFAEPTEVLRKFCPLFRDAFENEKEWDQVLKRFYKNSKQIHRYNNRLGDSKRYLLEKTTPVEALDGQQYKIASTFEDAMGKVHTWSLRDADPNSSATKIDSVLELMSSLTIFKKDDVRRFVKLENSEIDNCTRDIKIRKGKIVEDVDLVEELQAEVGLSPEADLDDLTEEEKLEIVKLLLPEGIVLTDTRMEELKEDVLANDLSNNAAEQPIDAAAPKAESISGSTASAVKEPPKAEVKKPDAQKPMALSAAEKSSDMNYKKPKSKKQKERESQAELFKKTPEGKRASRKRKKK